MYSVHQIPRKFSKRCCGQQEMSKIQWVSVCHALCHRALRHAATNTCDIAHPHLLYGLFIVPVLAVWFIKSRKTSSPPPGPPADPIIGHLRVIPSTNQADVFHGWAKIYGTQIILVYCSAKRWFDLGDVMYLHCLGKSMVVLDSVQAATDLLDKRSHIYSDRPRFVVFEL